MIAFTLLGSFGFKSGEDLSISGLPRRCISLVGYILLRRSERIYRDRIAAALWPDASDVEARGKLRRHLYLIGHAIPAARRDDWFVADNSTIGWNPAIEASTDVEELREAVRTERWRAAVDFYRGDLLAECDDEWLVDERDRLREWHVTNLERLALAERAAGSLSAAAQSAQELLRLEPWREAAVRILMETRQAMGDRAGALGEYERFEQRLRDDLDVEPMAETTALYAELVRGGARIVRQAAPEAPASLATSATASATPFVGREVQLEMLRETWSRARQQHGGLTFIGGESGVGKSRLVDELAACVVREGGLILRGGTTFIETSPYQAIVEALRSDSGTLASLADGAASRTALCMMLPELQRDAVEPAVSLGPEAERSRLFEAVVDALQTLARTRPLLLILEDLHWAGNGTIALLAHVARRIGRERVAVVATYRDDDLARAHPLRELRRQLGREGTAPVISLGPLTTSDVERFFLLRFGEAASAATAASYHAATDGLPLFLVELLAGATTESAFPVVPVPQLPQSLAATIERRLSDLPDSARAAMELAAVIGAGFDLELVAEASGWSEVETLRHVGDLIERHVVRELPGGGAGYTFAHAFYREHAYAGIPQAKRLQRHARVARALSDLYPDRLSELAPELARHYEEAGDRKNAVDFLVESARRASELFANEDALAYSERALTLQPAPRRELELRFLREEAYRRFGEREGQQAELVSASALAHALGDRRAERDVVQRSIALAHSVGDREAEKREIEAAERAPKGDDAWIAMLALARGRYQLRVSELREARINLTLAAKKFEALGDVRCAFDSYLTLVEVERSCEDLVAVEHCFDDAERQLLQLDDSRALVTRIYEERANYALARQQYLDADGWATRFLEAAQGIGDLAAQARGHRLVGAAAAWRLDVECARTHLERASALFTALDDRYHAYVVGYEFGLLAVWLGHVDEAIVRFERALMAAERLDYAYGVAASCISLGHARTLSGDYVRAESNARRAIEIAQRLGAESLLSPALVNLGIALVHRGSPAAALVPLTSGFELAQSAELVDLTAEATAYLALVEAELGNIAAAKSGAQLTLQLMATIPPALRSGSRYWIVAQVLQRIDRSADATQVIHDGRAVIRAQLESIPDSESRRTFAALSAHRALLSEERITDAVDSDGSRTVYA